MEHKGIVFNIQHFSVHDGPGIRTVVFLKGCPLRCRWCANPESQRIRPEMGWIKAECIGCGSCIKSFPELECRFEENRLYWNSDVPVDVQKAKRICPAEAFHVIGEAWGVKDALDEVEKDRTFYEVSGGGITVSGGEPLMQPSFVLPLLTEAGRRHLHRAIETCSYAPWPVYESIARETDYLLTDVKCMSDPLHKANTGRSNQLILKNLRKVRKAFPALPILIRTPVIPGVNDTREELSQIVSFVREIRADYQLLQYHRYGLPKYVSLNRFYPMGDVELPEEKFRALESFALRELYRDGYRPMTEKRQPEREFEGGEGI